MNCECDSSKQFQCANGRCIAREWLCDTMSDCEDNSDEPANCAVQNCTGSDQFACASGQCFPASWKCDGDIDCQPDGEDEVGCETVSAVYCDKNQFLCANKRCIRCKCFFAFFIQNLFVKLLLFLEQCSTNATATEIASMVRTNYPKFVAILT